MHTQHMITILDSIRYVGVIWIVIHVLQILPIRFTQQKSSCMFVDFLIGYIGPPNCA